MFTLLAIATRFPTILILFRCCNSEAVMACCREFNCIFSLFFSMTISWWIYCRISITISTVSCVPELFCWPPWTRWVGRNHSGVGLTAGRAGDWGMPRAGITSAFPSGSSFNETRHIGQVVCFRNHTSKQIRWKLRRHVGMIRRISFSLYSPKHMEHLPKENIH
jgi:hypothetical protein